MPASADAVLMVTRNLPPLVGGMERLLSQVLLALSARVPVELIGPRGVREHLPSGCRLRAELPFTAGAFLPGALLAVAAIADPARHQLCFGGSGLMAPALALARRRGLRSAAYLHGLDLLHPAWLYQRLFVSRLPTLDCLVANSRYTRSEALARGIPSERIAVVNPAVTMPVADPDLDAEAEALRRRHDGAPLLLSVGRLVARKGVAEFIEHGLPVLQRRCPGLHLVVVGSEPPAGRGRERARLEAALRATGLEAAVSLLGSVSERQLAVLYRAADLHLLPLVPVPGDAEGFGMVVLEAAAHGVPTVAFDLGGVSDALCGESGGRLVPAGDYEACVAAVQAELQQGGPQRRAQLQSQAAERSWKRFGEQLAEALALRF